MENTVSERIKFLIDTREKGNKSAFGRTVGISSQAVSDLIEAKGGPSFTSLQKILKGYPDINSDWLIFGEGEMQKGQQSKTTDLTSGEATVERATELASNGLLREIIDTQKETITDLRGTVEFLKAELGKFGGSSYAALLELFPQLPTGAAAEMVPA